MRREAIVERELLALGTLLAKGAGTLASLGTLLAKGAGALASPGTLLALGAVALVALVAPLR